MKPKERELREAAESLLIKRQRLQEVLDADGFMSQVMKAKKELDVAYIKLEKALKK